MNFAFLDFYEKAFFSYDTKINPFKYFLRNLFCGGLAGATSLTLIYPLYLARYKLSFDIYKRKLNNQRQFTSLIDCLKKITKKDGLLGLYKEFPISIFGITIYRSLYYGLFNTGKDYLFENMQKSSFFAVWSFA